MEDQLENLKKAFEYAAEQLFPPDFMKIAERHNMMTFYIGDVDFSIDRKTGFIAGSGKNCGNGRKWTISAR